MTGLINKRHEDYDAVDGARGFHDSPYRGGGGTLNGGCDRDGRAYKGSCRFRMDGRNKENVWTVGSCNSVGVGVGDWDA